MPVLQAELLTDFVTSIFGGTGAPAEEARYVAEHLVGANLRGHDSHGVIRTSGYVAAVADGRLVPGAAAEVERESETTAVVDGHWNYGQVVARFTMDVAIEKAKRYGVGIATAHCAGHIGRVGAYCEQAIEAGLLGIGSVNSPGARLVAAFGGAQRRLPTNPIAIGIPTRDPEAPFVLDMATSVVAEGKLKVALNKGATLPPDWILDEQGAASNNPADFYGDAAGQHQGALLPLGGTAGYKGFGLSLAIEALTGALSGAGTCVEGQRGSNGVFMMAIDYERFQERDAFIGQFSEVVDFVKTPPFREGVEEVLIPGDPERRRRAERLASGIELDAETWRQLGECARSVGVEPPALEAATA
ncbi:MAG: hypothetical protein GEU80_08850 [Dehalococcoidia bacterium]|nr:hypothetical protein [Dehalococcoidia bacterium]